MARFDEAKQDNLREVEAQVAALQKIHSSSICRGLLEGLFWPVWRQVIAIQERLVLKQPQAVLLPGAKEAKWHHFGEGARDSCHGSDGENYVDIIFTSPRRSENRQNHWCSWSNFAALSTCDYLWCLWQDRLVAESQLTKEHPVGERDRNFIKIIAWSICLMSTSVAALLWMIPVLDQAV